MIIRPDDDDDDDDVAAVRLMRFGCCNNFLWFSVFVYVYTHDVRRHTACIYFLSIVQRIMIIALHIYINPTHTHTHITNTAIANIACCERGQDEENAHAKATHTTEGK